MKDYYGPMEEWLPRARKWSLQSPGAINPPFKVPPGPDAVRVSSPYSQIVAFGDSMSDTGNLFRFTQAVGGLGMPMAPSNQGRFSNGVVALEVLANQLQLPLTNYCFSGGHSGKGNLLPFWSGSEACCSRSTNTAARCRPEGRHAMTPMRSTSCGRAPMTTSRA
jgi:hypothetical protein